jgi:hypothetical protein
LNSNIKLGSYHSNKGMTIDQGYVFKAARHIL